MKRLVILLSVFVLALSFNACEQHTVAALPPHYQHKLGEHHEVEHKEEAHAKTEGEHPAPATPEKKEH